MTTLDRTKNKKSKTPQKRSAKNYNAEPTQKLVSRTFRKVISKVKRSSGRRVREDSQSDISTDELNARIQQKAYEIFERRGYTHGYHEFDWALAGEFVCLEAAKAEGVTRKGKNLTEQDLNGKIEEKAYELFETSGYRPNNDALNWALAEELIRLEYT
ncbi:MAG: DUF2934 domain-containing protein [Candidatus Omnitrophica bacterium]|nr:DUF2934 domain-containing protein [Candidatus Omnitrophota bacterium]